MIEKYDAETRAEKMATPFRRTLRGVGGAQRGMGGVTLRSHRARFMQMNVRRRVGYGQMYQRAEVKRQLVGIP